MRCIICNTTFYHQTWTDPAEPCDCGSCFPQDSLSSADDNAEYERLKQQWKHEQAKENGNCMPRTPEDEPQPLYERNAEYYPYTAAHKFCPVGDESCDGCETYPLNRDNADRWHSAYENGDLSLMEEQDYLKVVAAWQSDGTHGALWDDR